MNRITPAPPILPRILKNPQNTNTHRLTFQLVRPPPPPYRSLQGNASTFDWGLINLNPSRTASHDSRAVICNCNRANHTSWLAEMKRLERLSGGRNEISINIQYLLRTPNCHR